MVRRVSRGWVIENKKGQVVGGPYYSHSYAEAREREILDTQRRQARLKKQRSH